MKNRTSGQNVQAVLLLVAFDLTLYMLYELSSFFVVTLSSASLSGIYFGVSAILGNIFMCFLIAQPIARLLPLTAGRVIFQSNRGIKTSTDLLINWSTGVIVLNLALIGFTVLSIEAINNILETGLLDYYRVLIATGLLVGSLVTFVALRWIIEDITSGKFPEILRY